MILGLKKAKEIIKDMKKQGYTIGLCSGGFDFLHPGHVKHFLSAKNFCDFLVVAVSNDEAVSKRKGVGRPVFKAEDTANMINYFKFVSAVIINPYEKSDKLILELVYRHISNSEVMVVTSDRALARQVQVLGAKVTRSGAFRRMLELD